MTRAKRLEGIRKEADEIRKEMESLVDEEAVYLYRLARKAEKHQCSASFIEELKQEAEALRTSFKAVPEQCLDDRLMDHFKHAFRGMR